ncbi:MAG: hypothetical protein R2727_09010 [Bacteroidales bacterium]
MDTTFKNYLKIDDFDEILNRYIHPVFSEVNKFNGIISILWHNNFFTGYKYKGYKDLYIKTIGLLKDEGVIFRTGSEIFADHFNNANMISGRLSVEQS